MSPSTGRTNTRWALLLAPSLAFSACDLGGATPDASEDAVVTTSDDEPAGESSEPSGDDPNTVVVDAPPGDDRVADEPLGDALDFIDARLAGAPMEGACALTAPVTCSNTPTP